MEVTNLGDPRGTALNILDSRIYWSDEDTNTIYSSDLEGMNIQGVVSELDAPH